MKYLMYVFLIVLVFKSTVFCQDNNQFPISLSEIDASTFEVMPEFPGGDSERIRFLKQNMRYPGLAIENKIEGTVIVSFTVRKSGKINNVEIVRGIGSGCDEEVVRLITSMPDWTPGIQLGKPVDVVFLMPVCFDLPEISPEYETEKELPIDQGEILFVAEVMPEFEGGAIQRTRFIQDNIKYPVKARSNRTQGTVYAKFIVEPDGSLANVHIISGIGDGCDEEVMRVINLMPKWRPGYQGNEPVRVEMVLPVKFGLETRNN
jgi:TonB family protein